MSWVFNCNSPRGGHTIFEGIHRLAPGETLLLRGGRITGRSHRHALPEAPPRAMAEDEALRLLDAALMDSAYGASALRCPLRHVSFGRGIDSSAILACMARLNDKPVRCVHGRFPEKLRAWTNANTRAP
jgi:asparagine synthase (glutamine-hydrolysing)